MPAHLCIEFKPGEGIAVAAGSLEEPVTDWLVHQGLGITATNKDDAVRVAFGNGPMLAKPARLEENGTNTHSGTNERT